MWGPQFLTDFDGDNFLYSIMSCGVFLFHNFFKRCPKKIEIGTFFFIFFEMLKMDIFAGQFTPIIRTYPESYDIL